LRPSTTAAVANLRDGANSLRRNALEQEQVSSTGGGTSVAAPTGAAGLFRQVLTTNGSYDGLMIQQVVGPDGKDRFIVYFNGTYSATRLTDLRNIPVAGGEVDTYVLGRIDDALRAAGYQPDADGTFKNGPDVMLVGYSQGGMDAQNIAHDGRYHVTDLVTYGSPLTYSDNSHINTVHLRADGDSVPDLPAEGLALAHGDVLGAAAIRMGMVEGPGDKVPLDQPWSGASQHIFQANPHVDPLNPIDAHGLNLGTLGGDILAGNHGVPTTYQSVGAAFDSSNDASLAADQRSLQKFQGDVVQSWSAVPKAPGGG
jgi:pimeloyl-ACP methyl ester carboxylesterase